LIKNTIDSYIEPIGNIPFKINFFKNMGLIMIL